MSQSPKLRLQALLRQRSRWALPVGVLVALAHGMWVWQSQRADAQEKFDVEARISHRLVSERLAALDTLLKAFVEAGPSEALARRLLALDPLARSLGVRGAATEVHAGEAAPATAALSPGLQGERLLLVAPLPGTDAAAPARAYLSVAVPELLRTHENVQALSTARLSDGRGTTVETRLAPPTQHRWRTEFAVSKPLRAGTSALQFHAQGALPLQLAGWLLSLLIGTSAVAAVHAWNVLRQLGRDRQRAERAASLSQAGRLQAMGELAAQVAHELNQPLAALLSQSQAASRMLDDAQPDLPLVRRALDNNVAQAQRAAAIVQRLRASVAGATLVRVPVALNERLQEMLFLLEPRLRARKVELVLEGLGGLPGVTVLGDPVQIDQILHNLLSNALDAMEQASIAQPILSVRAERNPPWVALRVHDSGPGVPATVQERLFEPFVSAKPGGTGLGLAIARTLAEHQGGELQLDTSAPRPGACFVLRLPTA